MLFWLAVAAAVVVWWRAMDVLFDWIERGR
jgi:hypothetical protein